LCTYVQVFLSTLKLFLEGQTFYQKLPFLAISGPQGHNVKALAVKFGMRVRSWGSLPQAKYCKNRLTGYTPFGQIYTKNYQFQRFWGL